MKKLILCLIILMVLLLTTLASNAATNTKVFYNESTYMLNIGISSFDNQYFFDASEFSTIVGLDYVIDNSSNVVTLNYKNKKTIFSIHSYDYSLNKSTEVIHDTPEMINGHLFFPFDFISSSYNFVIRYSSDNDSVYLLQNDLLFHSDINSFNNVSNNYSITVSDSIYLDLQNPSNEFTDNSITIHAKDASFKAYITCDRMDEKILSLVRQYLNDYTSLDTVIFQKLIAMKESYFGSLKDYYKNSFLYGTTKTSQSNLKVFKEYDEKLFDQQSHTILYNIIKQNGTVSSEETNINITIPVYSLKSIYTINFILQKGQLNEQTFREMSDLLKAISIGGLPSLETTPSVFSDFDTAKIANRGIYTDLNELDIPTQTLVNENSGYRISFPSTFLPYLQNNIFDDADYKSFKIDSNSYFSISSESYKGVAIQLLGNKLNSISTTTIDNNTSRGLKVRGKILHNINYSTYENNTSHYIHAYYTLYNDKLYTITLHSEINEPSEKLQSEFLKIVSSLILFTPLEQPTDLNLTFINYENKEAGYTFSYPSDWKLSNTCIGDIKYDTFSISNSDFSGPVNVNISERELLSDLSTLNISKYTDTKDIEELKKYFKDYIPPYKEKAAKLLLSGSYMQNNARYIYKLINFLDENDRSKLCYSLDIIRGKKVISIFITESDYATLDGKLKDKRLNTLVNTICSSFKVLNTPEHEQFLKSGETRNRKIVFLENYFKSKYGNTAKIDSASYLSSENDLFVAVSGIANSGFYRVSMDFDKKSIEITGMFYNTLTSTSTNSKTPLKP